MFYKIAYVLVMSVFRVIFRPHIYGRENIPDGAAVVCANHTASTDPIFLAMGLTIHHQIHFMAKQELMKNPLLKLILRGLGTFAVNRGESDIKSIKHAFSLLKAGKKLGIFPEGTRVQEDETSEAKTGAAMLSIRSGAPFLPVSISRGRKHLFARVNIVIGKAYQAEVPGGRKATPECYQVVAEELMQRIYKLEKCHA